MSAAEFLRELWGPKPSDSVLVWRLDGRRSRWLRSFKREPVELGEPDVYTGVGLAKSSYGRFRRCPRHEIVAIPGLWADIDVNFSAGPAGRVNAHPTVDDAIETAYSLAEPTILLWSGYGFQAWWLFEGGPWRFRTYGDQRLAAKAAAQWQALLRAGTEHNLDFTHDLARVMRLPHTNNTKRIWKHRCVEVMETGPRHERDELFSAAGHAGDVDPGYILSGQHKSVTLRDPRSHETRTVEYLLSRSSMFLRTWEHARPELPSMSEHDLSLGSIAALAGASDQQIADVITTHRDHHNDPKGARVDYLQRTISKIRTGGES